MNNESTSKTKCRKDGKKNSPSKPTQDALKNSSLVPRRQNKLDQALHALSLTREKLATCEPLQNVIQQSLGNVSVAIEAMRFSSDPTIEKFLIRYDTASEQQKKSLPLEAFALAAEVEIPALLGATILAFKSLQAQKSTLRVMADHPDIVKKTIKVAKTTKGVADRRMIHEAVGFLPTKSGISINQVFGGQLPQKRDDDPPSREVHGEPVEFDELFEPITHNLEKWQGNKQKLLKGSA